MHRLLSLFLCLSLLQSVRGQATYLHLSEKEMQEVTESPEKVAAKIKELTALSEIPSSLPDRIAILQTIVLLELYSDGSECELSRVYGQISELMMQMDATEDALLLGHRSLELARTCQEYQPAAVFTDLGRMGTFHMNVGNLDSAIFYFREAKAFADTLPDPIWYASALNNLGMAWTKIGQSDSAFSYYNRAIFGLNTSDPAQLRFLGCVNDNLAEWHQSKGNHRVALQFYEENILINRQFADTPAMVYAMLGLGNEQLATGRLKEASATLDSITHWLEPYTSDEALKTKLMFETSMFKKEVRLAQKDLNGALKASDEALFWQKNANSLAQHTRKVMIGALNHAEIIRVNQEIALRDRLSTIEERSSQRLIITLGVIGLLLLIIAYLSYVMKHVRESK